MEAALSRIWRDSVQALLEANDPWTQIARAISREFAGGSVLLSLAPGWSPLGSTAFAAIDSSAVQSVAEYYHAVNPWAPHQGRWTEGYFGPGSDVLSRMDLVHTEFYNDWMRPSRLGTVSYGGFALRRNGFDELTLGVLHDRSVEDYSEEDMNLGRALMPCLRSCFLLRERLVSRLDQSESRSGDVGECSPDLAATAVLDRMSYGAVVLNARGFIQYANGAAEDAFRRGVPLRKVGRRVIVCGSARGDRFDRLVASVLDHPAASRGGAVAWVDEDGSSRMLLIVLPFGGSAGGDLQSVLVLLLPALERRTAPELILRDAWGLTPREALLCQAMASHRNVEVAAEMVEISYAHALVRLKTIRSKLSVTSNGELIELISTLGRLRWD